MGGKQWPGIDCLRMHNHSQKNLGIRLHLEIVGKIDTYIHPIYFCIIDRLPVELPP